jgi:type III pantothenate kinase
MDINLLAVDVGNTRTGIGVFKSGELVYARNVSHAQKADWPGMIAEAWKHLEGAGGEVAGVSSAGELAGEVAEAVKAAIGKSVAWVGQDLDLPVKVLATGAGVDRVLNIAAAHEQMGKSCCVVDAGTAVTVDFCDEAGTFLGGFIAPGFKTQLESLRSATNNRLPIVEPAKHDGHVGTDTEDAMRGGVRHAIRGLVQQASEQFAVEQGGWPEIIVSGGDARTLFDGWELVHAVSPELTLYGVALAYANHHIQHGT